MVQVTARPEYQIFGSQEFLFLISVEGCDHVIFVFGVLSSDSLSSTSSLTSPLVSFFFMRSSS